MRCANSSFSMDEKGFGVNISWTKMRKWAQASLVPRQSQPGYLLALRRKSRRIPRSPRPKRSCPGDADERPSARFTGDIALCRITNETINNYSLVLPFRRRGEKRNYEIDDEEHFQKNSHVQNPRHPYQQVVVVNLWFLTFAPAVAIPRSGLRFLAPG
jgi:hypothetical protein